MIFDGDSSSGSAPLGTRTVAQVRAARRRHALDRVGIDLSHAREVGFAETALLHQLPGLARETLAGLARRGAAAAETGVGSSQRAVVSAIQTTRRTDGELGIRLVLEERVSVAAARRRRTSSLSSRASRAVARPHAGAFLDVPTHDDGMLVVGLICGTGTATGSLIVKLQACGAQCRRARQHLELEGKCAWNWPRLAPLCGARAGGPCRGSLRRPRHHLAREVKVRRALFDDDQLACPRHRFEHGSRIERRDAERQQHLEVHLVGIRARQPPARRPCSSARTRRPSSRARLSAQHRGREMSLPSR